MMTRSNHIKKCIESASFLCRSCQNEHQVNPIMARAIDMIDDAWAVEYESIKREAKGIDGYRKLLVKDFWTNIRSEIWNEDIVYDITILYGDDINPPGKEGNVLISVQPIKSVSFLLFSIKYDKQKSD